MKLLLVHAESFSYEARIKSTSLAESLDEVPASASFDNVVVAFVSVETRDAKDLDAVVSRASDAIVDIVEKVGADRVLIYPFKYLSPALAPPRVFLRALKMLEEHVARRGVKAARAPFGWYKRFYVRCRNHPLAEVTIEIRA